MKQQFTSAQLYTIMSQSPDSECACPAQVCGSLVDLRELYDYQAACLRGTSTDLKMHEAIALATTQAHDILEKCLKEILDMAGWDFQTMAFSESPDKKIANKL